MHDATESESDGWFPIMMIGFRRWIRSAAVVYVVVAIVASFRSGYITSEKYTTATISGIKGQRQIQPGGLGAQLPCVINIPKGILRFLEQCGNFVQLACCHCIPVGGSLHCRYTTSSKHDAKSTNTHSPKEEKFFQTNKVFKKCHKIFTCFLECSGCL